MIPNLKLPAAKMLKTTTFPSQQDTTERLPGLEELEIKR
jgi:hypothetical protein